MGKLYDYCEEIQRYIERNGLDVFQTRGALALNCGFLITLIRADDPDDPERIQALQNAAQEILGLRLG